MRVPKMVENGQNSAFAFENMTALAKKAWKLGKFKTRARQIKKKQTQVIWGLLFLEPNLFSRLSDTCLTAETRHTPINIFLLVMGATNHRYERTLSLHGLHQAVKIQLTTEFVI
jgi:hypothetical protein